MALEFTLIKQTETSLEVQVSGISTDKGSVYIRWYLDESINPYSEYPLAESKTWTSCYFGGLTPGSEYVVKVQVEYDNIWVYNLSETYTTLSKDNEEDNEEDNNGWIIEELAEIATISSGWKGTYIAKPNYLYYIPISFSKNNKMRFQGKGEGINIQGYLTNIGSFDKDEGIPMYILAQSSTSNSKSFSFEYYVESSLDNYYFCFKNTSSTTNYIDLEIALATNEELLWEKKVSGKPFDITALEWSNLLETINEINDLKGLSRYNFLYPDLGYKFKAEYYNEVLDAISMISKQYYDNEKVQAGDPITAQKINLILDLINNL